MFGTIGCLKLSTGIQIQKFWHGMTDVISVSVVDQTKSPVQALSKSGAFSSDTVTPEEECLLHLMNFKCAVCLQGSLKFRGVRGGSSPHGIGPGGQEKQGHAKGSHGQVLIGYLG